MPIPQNHRIPFDIFFEEQHTMLFKIANIKKTLRGGQISQCRHTTR